MISKGELEMALKTTMLFLLLIMLPVATEAKKPVKSKMQTKFTREKTCDLKHCLGKCCKGSRCDGECCKFNTNFKDCMEYLESILARYFGNKNSNCVFYSQAKECCPTASGFKCHDKVCSLGWREFGGKSCYFVNDTITTKWSDARAVCQNLGGDLAVITSAEENDFVYELVMEKKTVTETKAWIGLKKNTGDSNWYWVDGTPLEGQYENWGEGEPNNWRGNENCAHFFGQPEKWNDVQCEMTGGWARKSPTILCEKPPTVF